MTINFPSPATLNQIYSSPPQQWLFDGAKWTALNSQGSLSLYLPLTGGELSGPGNLKIDGTLNVVGATTLGGGLAVTGNTALQIATATTPATADSSVNVATTAFVKNQGYATTAGVAGAYLPLSGGTISGNLTVTGSVSAGSVTGTNVYGTNSVQSNGVYFQNSGGQFYVPQQFYCASNVVAAGNVYVGGTSIYWQNNGSYMYTNQNLQSAGTILAQSNLNAQGGVVYLNGMYWQNNAGYMYCPWPIHTDAYININGLTWENQGGWMHAANALRSANVVASFAGSGVTLNQLGAQYTQYAPNQMTLWWTGGLVYIVVDNSNQGWVTFNGCDRNLKTNFGPVTRDCLAAINAIVLESFDWPQTVPSYKRISEESRRNHIRFEEQSLRTPHWEVGYTAQQVREVIPEAVPEPPEGGNLGVDLQMMVAHLVGAVQQLSGEVSALKARTA